MATPIPRNRSGWSLADILSATGGVALRNKRTGETAIGASTDSREVARGGVFVALRGEHADGHNFLSSAIASGVTTLVVEEGTRLPDGDVNAVAVPDTLRAWGAMAAFHLTRWRQVPPRKTAVVITGTAGKTTSKELTATLLKSVDSCHATAGNLNNRIGLPAVALCTEFAHTFAVFEIGMSVPGEIATLADIVCPDVAVITNIGIAHAAGVGGAQGVAKEKGALFAALSPAGTAIVNLDDPAVVGQSARLRTDRRVSFGVAREADYRILGVVPAATGSQVMIERPATGAASGRETIDVPLPLPGRMHAHNLAAALAAAEAALRRTIPTDVIVRALASVALPPGRVAMRSFPRDITVIDDTYNANPTSVASAVELLCERATSGRRAVVVLGEMLELGETSRVEHEKIGQLIGEKRVGLLVGCGGMTDAVLSAAEPYGTETVAANSASEAAPLLLSRLLPGDVVLVKGSRSVGTEVVVEKLVSALGSAPPGPEGDA